MENAFDVIDEAEPELCVLSENVFALMKKYKREAANEPRWLEVYFFFFLSVFLLFFGGGGAVPRQAYVEL